MAQAAFIHEPDPDFPGWHTWKLDQDDRFNSEGLGRMVVRREDDTSARLRLVDVAARHSNLHDKIHGGAILALIDVGVFAAIYAVLGPQTVGGVTLDLHSQFIGAGRVGQPLDVVTEVMRETGRLIFVRGTAEQDDHLVASFVATLRKPSVSQ